MEQNTLDGEKAGREMAAVSHPFPILSYGQAVATFQML
jgi:hypothetical protein